MENNFKTVIPIILLGRPFMATTNTIIDVHDGKLSMIMLGETVKFEVTNSLLLPSETCMDECAFIEEIDACVDDFCVNNLKTNWIIRLLTWR